MTESSKDFKLKEFSNSVRNGAYRSETGKAGKISSMKNTDPSTAPPY